MGAVRSSRFAETGSEHSIRVSFEFFPPKTADMERSLWEAIGRLAPLLPHFVSVTYGAGGSTRERTHATVKRILTETMLTPAAHLTCVAATRTEVDAVIEAYAQAGVRHIVALRGDPLGGIGESYAPHPGGYRNAADLVAGIKRIADIEVSVSAYPEKHPDSASVAADIDMLKAKVDAGASRAITQFFFENDLYFRYLDRVRAAGIDIPIVPGILPVQNFKQTKSFAARTGASVPDWLAARFDGLDDDPSTRKLIAAAVAAEQVLDLVDHGVTDFHFYTMNRADLVYAICHLARTTASAMSRPHTHFLVSKNIRLESVVNPSEPAKETTLRQLAAKRILVLDGAMGTMIQALRLDEEGYRGARFDAWNREVRGNNDLLNLSRPDAVRAIHLAYFRAGADIVSTNTFSSTRIAQADYGMAEIAHELNAEGARLAREAARDRAGRGRPAAFRRRRHRPNQPHRVDLARCAEPELPRRHLRRAAHRLCRTGARPSRRRRRHSADRDDLRHAQRQGRDLRLRRSHERARHSRAGDDFRHHHRPRRAAFSPGRRPRRSGIRSLMPRRFRIGLNCALGARQMRAHIAELGRVADTLICAYPNAGLPNEFGHYDESPQMMAAQLGEFADAGLVNIVGGCCGTTPDHIRAIAAAVAGKKPRQIPDDPAAPAALRA